MKEFIYLLALFTTFLYFINSFIFIALLRQTLAVREKGVGLLFIKVVLIALIMSHGIVGLIRLLWAAGIVDSYEGLALSFPPTVLITGLGIYMHYLFNSRNDKNTD